MNESDPQIHFLEGGGEMGERIRTYDWSSSPVGPSIDWPMPLRCILSVMLHSPFPMLLWWGDELIQFYNDGYRILLGENGRHPQALGQRAQDCWTEVWNDIHPLILKVLKKESVYMEDEQFPVFRNGKLEEAYWTFSYSPVTGSEGNAEGVLVICNETTSKVRTVDALTRSKETFASRESNLRNILIQAPVAMCILKGPTHKVEIANDKMYQLWGTTSEKVQNKPIFEGLPELRNQGFEELLDNVYRTGETFSANGVSVQVPRTDGMETININFVYEPFYMDNEITGVMVAAVDVTEEVNARNRIEESETLLRSIVESAPFPIGVYTGREMRIKLLNQAIIDVWGKGPDVVGKTYAEVLPELESQNIYPQLEGVYNTGIPFHARNQRVDLVAEGRLKPFYFNYSFTPLFDNEGKVFGVMNTAADVTDLIVAKQKVEQSEKNFRNMVKQAPVAMCIMMGPDHTVEVANDLFLNMWGKKEKEILNKPVFEGLPFPDRKNQATILSDVYHNGRSYRASERPVTYRSGSQVKEAYQNVVYEPYRGTDGNIIGVLTISIDVTEQVAARRKIEEIVAERTRDLKKSNDELTQFAYITSHDLQEPARKISTFSEMLLDRLGDTLDEKSAGYLEKIENSSRRMLTLIRDVLGISQLSKSSRQYVRVDLEDILDETLSDFELLIAQNQVRMERSRLPVVEAIPIQMRQLFGNLISNSLKFRVPDKAPVITIESREISSDELQLRAGVRSEAKHFLIAFKDNGIGFDQENAEQIFNIFQRLHAKSEYEGTGIGLALCKKIAENHKGQIQAVSAPGEGARFEIILPEKQSVES